MADELERDLLMMILKLPRLIELLVAHQIHPGSHNAHLLQKRELGRVRKKWEVPLRRCLQHHLGYKHVHRRLAQDISRSSKPLRVFLREGQASIHCLPSMQAIQIIDTKAVGIDALSVDLHVDVGIAMGGKSLPGQRKALLQVFHLPVILTPPLETVKCS